MTKIASPAADTSARRPARPAMTLKWSVVLASLALATVIDGMSISDMAKPGLVSTEQQAGITLPADRCEPGCAIMMASNVSGDRVQ